MNAKALKIIIAIFAAVAVVSATVFFISLGGRDEKDPAKAMPKAYSYEQSDYTLSQALSVVGKNSEIYLPTDIDNVFYTASLNGEIAFFEYTAAGMAPSLLPVKQIKVSLAASYEKIPVTVNYIEKDGKICGFGVFTSDMDSSVDVYSYAFVKLTAKPAGYGSGYLLLADFDKDNFYNSNKLYSEIYNFNISTGSASIYVSNNTRLIDKNGSFRQDWTLLTDDFIKNLGDKNYFLSSRYYNSSDRGLRADVMVLSSAYRPKIVVEDILGLWFVNGPDGMRYLKRTASGFACMVNNGSAETPAVSFEGEYFTDYLQCGKYIINKKSLELTDLVTGTSRTLKDIDISSADLFTVSPDGSKAVFACKGEANANGALVQTLAYCVIDGSVAPAVFIEPLLFNESAGFVWLSDSQVMSVRALSGDGASVGSVIYSF